MMPRLKQFAHPGPWLILIAAMLTNSCATNPVTGRGEVVLMSEAQEIDIGRRSHPEIIQHFGEYEDRELQAYVHRVGERLAANSHRPELIYRFTVLDSKEVNAFALPGGYIYITRGLLAYFNDEASLAAVLGHEIGHVTARHSVRQYSAAQMANIGAVVASIFVPGVGTPLGGQAVNILGTAMLRGYGREHELEADRLGAIYLARSGYNPMKMLDVLGTLKDQEQFAQQVARAEGREPSGGYHGLFATHPDNDTRLQEVIMAARDLQVHGDPFIGRDEFLQLIDGLVYGDSKREGIIRGNAMYHADLDFAMRFPRGWRIDNRPTQVLATAPDGGGVLVLQAEDLGKRMTPREYLHGRLRPRQVSDEREFEINGLPAYTLRTIASTQWGQRPARYTTLFHRDKAYTIAGASRDTDQDAAHDVAFLEAAQSFHALTENERLLAEPLRLRIVEPEPGMTYAGLAEQSPLRHMAEGRLRLLNSAWDGRPLEPGQAVKIIQ